jgi:cytochrome P450
VSDIMGDVTFSKNWDVQRDKERRHFVDDSALGTAGIHLVSLHLHPRSTKTPPLPLVLVLICIFTQTGHMPGLFFLSMHKILFWPLIQGVQQLARLSDSITEWRVAQGANLKGKDLFSALLEAVDPVTGKRFTQGELISEAGLLIVGGSDTTVTAMSATIFYLLHNPATLARAQREVRNTFSSLEEIMMAKSLDGCRYLVACIDESLRLSPPVGSILPRQVLAGGLRVEGEYLPEGTDVGVPHYALHHNPAYYRDPFTVQPERWIGSGEGGFTEIDVATAQTAFTAFGVGRTNCIGRHLAYQEILLVIGRLLFEYDMRLDSQSTLGEGGPGKGWGRHRKDEYQLMDRFVSMQDGPMVQFRVRSK